MKKNTEEKGKFLNISYYGLPIERSYHYPSKEALEHTNNITNNP